MKVQFFRGVLLLLVVLILTFSSTVVALKAAPAQKDPQCKAHGGTAGNEVPSSYFSDLLSYMKIPASQFALDALVAWKKAENTDACWNPLATTLPGSKLSPPVPSASWRLPHSSAGVQEYISEQYGVEAEGITLLYTPRGAGTSYVAIRQMLAGQAFDATQLRQEICLWGGCNYADSLISKWQKLWKTLRQRNWLPGWSYRQKIAIDRTRIDSDLVDFPLLVKLSAANFDFSRARANGYDIRFTSSDGTSLLTYERERHDSSSKLAEYWVKIPLVSSASDTGFYLYYGKPDATDGADSVGVWDSGFKAVWHLKESGNGSPNEFRDSTSNDNHGQGGAGTASSVPTQIEGKIGKAQDLDGVDDFIAPPNPLNNFNPQTGFTIEAWVKTDVINPSDNKRIYFQGNTALTSLLIPQGTNDLRFEVRDAPMGAEWKGRVYSGIVTGRYYHVVGTWSPEGRLRLYVDGTQIGDDVLTRHSLSSNTAVPPRIGMNKGTVADVEYWNGVIDELRVSNVVRSPTWVKTSYLSGNNSLLNFGSEETATALIQYR